VPIIFAIIALAENVPYARLIFNIVFFCTLVSLVIQGTTLPSMAKWLKLTDKRKRFLKLENFDIELSEDIKSVTSEISISAQTLINGNRLMDLSLPDKTIVVLVKREGKYFVPTGITDLKENDILLVITDDYNALMETYANLGIKKE
jgi:cell volume regulation protein A